MKTLQVVRDDAITICVAFGYATASKWNRNRMNEKMKDIGGMDPKGLKLEEDTIDSKSERARLNKILVAMGTADEIDVVKELGAEPDIEEAPADTAKDTPVEDDGYGRTENEPTTEEAVEDAPPTEAEEAPKPAKSPKKPKKGKKAKAAEKAAETAPAKKSKPSPEKKAPRKSRHYCAGVVIKKYGHDTKVTGEMVNEVDAMYGKDKANFAESDWALKMAQKSVQGYLS